MKPISPITFISRLIKKSELGQPFKLFPFQEEILNLAFDFDENGRLSYDTIVFSCPKKSGKSTLNGAVTLWWAFTQEPPNTCLLVANDLEQSLARVFRTIEGIIEHNPQLKQEAEVQSKAIYLANGTELKAIASDYEGEAGANQGWVSWDEPWALTSERSRRLWEELTSVPTRRNSVKFATTYAGFSSESQLLWDLYIQSVGREEHPDGKGERIHPSLPIYANKEARVFAYWDHEPRLPWQTPEYYDAQRRTLRPNTYSRLHENRWTSGEESFISAELWDSAVEPDLKSDISGELFIGVDAAVKRDCASVVCIKYSEDDDRLQLADYRIWRPGPQGLNLEATIEFFIRRLYNNPNTRIAQILVDPFQMQRSIQTLQSAGLPIQEFNQTLPNLTLATETLLNAFTNRNLRLYRADDLRSHVLSAIVVESPRGFRLAKGHQSAKVDGCVALSFGVLSAIQNGKPPTLEELQNSPINNWKPSDNDFNPYTGKAYRSA